jgi:hypothetical protein
MLSTLDTSRRRTTLDFAYEDGHISCPLMFWHDSFLQTVGTWGLILNGEELKKDWRKKNGVSNTANTETNNLIAIVSSQPPLHARKVVMQRSW